jgi:endonuclease YncB( thermonuclease family)
MTTPIDNELLQLTTAPTYHSAYENKLVTAKIVSVYDGDTCNAIFRVDVGLPYYNYKVRLVDIDTPEMKPPLNTPNRDIIIAKAKQARDFIKEKTNGQLVTLELQGLDKYGRVLAKIYLSAQPTQESCINTLLIGAGLAKAYDGGTKAEWVVQ